MIKLELPQKPQELTSELEKELVEKYKTDKSSVWSKDYIRNALMKMSFGKCAYSEIKLGEESKPMTVDHYKCKEKYPELVVSWGNLLPSCSFCNSKKGRLDVSEYQIINPLNDNPQDFIYFSCGRLYAKNERGRLTIDRLGLNNRNEIANIRQDAIFVVDEHLEQIKTDDLNLVAGDLFEVMNECTKDKAFSAALATHLLFESELYQILKSQLQSSGNWDDCMQQLETELYKIALPK